MVKGPVITTTSIEIQDSIVKINKADCQTSHKQDIETMGDIWFDATHVEAWLGGHPVIHDVCLQLRTGESTTILGPNGAGKSTIVNLINRNLYPLVKPDSHFKLFGQTTINICCYAPQQELQAVIQRHDFHHKSKQKSLS